MSLYPQQLDVNRLHEATETILTGKYRYRQQGLTVAYLYLMAGELQFPGPGNFLYIGESRVATEEARHAFGQLAIDEVAEWNPFTYMSSQRMEFMAGQRFQFAGINQYLESVLCGNTFDRIYFDICDATRANLAKAGKLMTIDQELRIHLNVKHGELF